MTQPSVKALTMESMYGKIFTRIFAKRSAESLGLSILGLLLFSVLLDTTRTIYWIVLSHL